MLEKQYTLNDIADAMQVTRASIERWIKKGDIPAPIKYGNRTVRYPAHVAEAIVNGERAYGERDE